MKLNFCCDIYVPIVVEEKVVNSLRTACQGLVQANPHTMVEVWVGGTEAVLQHKRVLVSTEDRG